MQNVLVTGHKGFIGSKLTQRLHELGVSWESIDLDWSDAKSKYVDLSAYDTIFHLAALVGGIGWNMAHPADMITKNVLIAYNMLEAVRHYDGTFPSTTTLIIPGSACAYADMVGKMAEPLYLQGEPHWSNLPYGYAKRSILVMLRAYKEQYGLNFNYPILANVYGPGIEFKVEKLHVIPALAYKFLDLSQPVKVLGTGKAVRDYLYIDDAVEALIHSATTPRLLNRAVNYGSGSGYSVSYIVDTFKYLAQRFDVEYDEDAPDGQMCRLVDTRLSEAHGYKAQTTFDAGLRRTWEWVTKSKS